MKLLKYGWTTLMVIGCMVITYAIAWLFINIAFVELPESLAAFCMLVMLAICISLGFGSVASLIIEEF